MSVKRSVTVPVGSVLMALNGTTQMARAPLACRRRSLLHELMEELSQLLARIAGDAGVHLRGLDDGARRGDEPVEPRGRVELRDRPGCRVARGDLLGRREVRAHRLHVELRPER